jgi:hypothetical protein
LFEFALVLAIDEVSGLLRNPLSYGVAGEFEAFLLHELHSLEHEFFHLLDVVEPSIDD